MSYDLFAKEHESFRLKIRNFIRKEIVPNVLEWEENGFPREAVRKLADEGLFGLKFPWEIGGGGHDALMAGVFIEELARCGMAGFTAGILTHSEIVLQLLFGLGDKDQKSRYLAPGMAGEKFGALAHGDPASVFDMSSCETTAKLDGDRYIVNGKKFAVLNGSVADFIVISAKTVQEGDGSGLTTFIIDSDAEGLKRSSVRQVGYRSGDFADLVFEDLTLPAHNVLGTPNNALPEMEAMLEWICIVTALASSSSSLEIWRKAVRYAKKRRADGRPLIKHQAVAFELADSISKITASVELARDCLWKRSRGLSCRLDALAAKLYGADTMQDMAETALGVFGSEGLVENHEAERFMRDARVFSGQAGGTGLQMERMADLIGL